MYFPIAGSTFVGIYKLPSFKYEDWQLLAAIPLGLVAGALALITVVAVAGVTRLATRLGNRTILRATIGGIAFGLVGVALPLTLFTGTDQLDTVIHDGATLGAGLLIAVVFAKILVFALCEATGFIGGPFLVMLFIGGTAGIRGPSADPGAAGGARVHRNVRRPSRGARRRPVLADPARCPHDPDRHPAGGPGRDRRPHRLPRRLRLRAARGAGQPRAQTRQRRRNAGHRGRSGHAGRELKAMSVLLAAFPLAALTQSRTLFELGLVTVLAAAAPLIAQVLRLPSILLLLALGFGAGAIGALDPNALLGQQLISAVVSIAVGIILFDAGLGLKRSKLTGDVAGV